MAVPSIAWGAPSGDRADAAAPVAAWPSGAADDVLFLFVGSKPGATIATPAGWTPVLSPTTGGSMIVAVYTRTAPSTAAGSVTVSIGSADATACFAGRAPAGTTVPQVATGTDTSAGTGYTATSPTVSLDADDLAVAVTAYGNDATGLTATLSETGAAAVGTTTVRVVANMLNGSDMNLAAVTAPVTTAGSSTLTMAGTYDGDTAGGTGITAFLVVRGQTTTTPPATPTGLAVTPATTTASVTWAASSGATSYEVEWAETGATPTGTVVDRWNGTALVRQRADRWTGTALAQQTTTP